MKTTLRDVSVSTADLASNKEGMRMVNCFECGGGRLE